MQCAGRCWYTVHRFNGFISYFSVIETNCIPVSGTFPELRGKSNASLNYYINLLTPRVGFRINDLLEYRSLKGEMVGTHKESLVWEDKKGEKWYR